MKNYFQASITYTKIDNVSNKLIQNPENRLFLSLSGFKFITLFLKTTLINNYKYIGTVLMKHTTCFLEHQISAHYFKFQGIIRP